MAFDQGLSSSMETMFSRQLGRTTMGGGKMNAMVATSDTFDTGGPMSNMNGMRMGVGEERRAEYEQTHRSPLDINMQMISAMRGDESAWGGPGGGGHSGGGWNFGGGPDISSPSSGGMDYGAPDFSGPASGGPSMTGPDVHGGPVMKGPEMPGPDLSGGPGGYGPNTGGPSIQPGPQMHGPSIPEGPQMNGPSVHEAPGGDGPDMMGGMERQEGPPVVKAETSPGGGSVHQGTPMNPQVMVIGGMERQTGPDVQKSESAPATPTGTLGSAVNRPRREEDEEEDEELLPVLQGVACPSMIRPTEIPDSMEENDITAEIEATKEDLLDRKLRQMSGDNLADLAEQFFTESERASTKEEKLLANSKIEIIGKEVERRVEEGIMDAGSLHA